MSGQCDLSRLDGNLFTIAESGNKPLVADLPSCSLMGPWTAFGRLLTWYYGSLEAVCGVQNLEQEKFAATLQNIKSEFASAIDSFAALDQKYRAALLQSPNLEKTVNDEQEIAGIGRRCTFLFSREALFSPRTALQPVQQFFQQKTGAPLISDEQFAKLAAFDKDYAIAMFVGILQMHFPTNCFMKLCDDEPLSEIDRATLREWTSCVEANKHRLNVWLLHLALTGLVELFYNDLQRAKGSLVDVVGILEWRLYQGYLFFLNEPDPRHLEWIRTLVPQETKIKLGQSEHTLGQRVHFASLDACHAALFELENDPEHQLLALSNPALIGMWQSVSETCAKELKPVQIFDKDPYLRFCLIERVDLPLSDIPWKSRVGLVQAEDRPALNALCHFLYWLSTSPKLPEELDPASMFFKKQRAKLDLRVIFPLKAHVAHNYLLLESFARGVAKSNQLIFRTLMHESGLVKHPVACFLRDIVKKRALGSDDALSVKDEAILAKITDQKLIDEAEKLIREMGKIVRPLTRRLSTRLKKESDLPKLQEIVKNHFAKLMLDSGYSSQLPPLFTDGEAMKLIEADITEQARKLF